MTGGLIEVRFPRLFAVRAADRERPVVFPFCHGFIFRLFGVLPCGGGLLLRHSRGDHAVHVCAGDVLTGTLMEMGGRAVIDTSANRCDRV
jgi:hypothetical protein